MIHALDHLLLAAADQADASGRLEIILAAPPRAVAVANLAGAWFALANTSLFLAHTAASGPLELPELPAETPAALAAAAFAVEDLPATLRRYARRGLPAGEPFTWSDTTAALLDPAATHGVRLVLVQRPRAAATPAPIGLDHVVIRTPNPNRALALYGARLGLDLRLERRNWGTHFLFFRCGDLVVEVVHPLDAPVDEGPDAFSGLAFRAADLPAQHARLVAAGAPLSDLKPGRKPGTHLFTVRNPLAVVPSIFITQERD